MDKETVLGISSTFRKAMESQGITIDRLILFGSHASGQWHRSSDIDLVVVSQDFHGRGFWERIDLLTNAIYNVFAPIEAVAMTPEEWDRKESLVVDYALSGEVIYEKTVNV